jgi:intracellular sulfur oxidation DsrE/DsrF family protein
MRRARLALFVALAALALAAGAQPVDHVLYEMPSKASARVVLRAIDSHLGESRSAVVISVVVHGGGVLALLREARDEKGAPFAPDIARLARRGVDFAVCEATLNQRGIAAARVLPEARIVDGGNAELARLAATGYRRMN